MGSVRLIRQSSDGNLPDVDHLDPTFRNNAGRWLSSLPFDTEITSAFRSLELQQILKKKLPKLANEAGYSAHNYGFAIDVWPVPRTADNIAYMRQTAPSYGIRGITNETWHFQDVKFSLEGEQEKFKWQLILMGLGAFVVVGATMYLSFRKKR